MQKRIPIKNHQREIQLITRRIMLAGVIICCAMFLLIVRLAYLQIYKSDLYTTLSTQNWLDLVPMEPTRGLIFDRNGILLAENVPVFSLDAIPFQINDLSKTLASLSKIVNLSEDDIHQFKKQLRQHRRFDEIPLKFRLTEEEVARFTENQHRFLGIFIKARLMRHYPFGELFSHVIGYVGRINAQELNEIDPVNYSASHYIGKLGIEKFYEEELHGKVGYEQVENDASGKPIRVLQEIKGIPGKNIYLTIDSKLQMTAKKALEGRRGAIVAIQPGTGQILAMVSNPGYDPNMFVTGVNWKDYQTLRRSEDRPLFDRALSGLYPPASTIKPFLALQALVSGITTPETTIFDAGWFELTNNNHRFHDWAKHGKVNLSKALITSCDTYFYDLGNKMGIKLISSILKQFGFGTLTGIDLEGEFPGVVASPEWKQKAKGITWYEGDTVLSAIGQGFMQATPLQLAVAASILANRGIRFLPYLLLSEQEPGKPLVSQTPIALESVVLQDGRYWDIVIKAMQEVVTSTHGTAHKYFGKHYTYTVAAKTGTAQLSKRRNPDEMDKQENLPEKLRDHHLFIAFAPVEKPVIALAVVTENSNTVVEAARIIFDYYLGKNQNANRPSQGQTEKAAA